MLSLDPQAPIDASELVAETPNEFRVHKRAYTDEEIFRAEMDRIFGNTWVYVAHESEIANPGDYVTTSIGMQPVIVSRDEDGGIHVLLNRCLHRGSIVCRYDKGNSNYFRCPYHGWVYSASGKLTGVAQKGSGYGEDFETPEGLGRARVETYRGLIFANLGDSETSLREHLGEATRYLDLQFDRSPVGETEARYGTFRTSYKGNWKFQCENSTDGYHGDYVHESFFKVVEQFGNRSGQHNTYSGKFAEIKRQRAKLTYTRSFPQGHGLWVSPATQETVDQMREKYPEYVGQLEKKHGTEKLIDLFSAFNMYIWPNVAILQGQIRVIKPIRVDETEVHYYQLAWQGVPEEYNTEKLRGYERFFGPAGFGAPDDVEIFKLNNIGLQAEKVEWLILDRGLSRDDPAENARGADETPQRSLWRAWREAMRE